MQLHTLDNLFQARERELKELIGNLQIDEVREDKRFKAKVAEIKAQVLLKPVTIGQPKIEGNRQETRKVPPNYQMMWGGQQAVNIVTVSFPITGSSDLFEYRASGASLTMSNIYAPEYNSITLDIEVPALDKAQVLATANKELETTRSLILQNNPIAEVWSERIDQKTDTMAAEKRKELMDFYS
jgi:hypothetical protein